MTFYKQQSSGREWKILEKSKKKKKILKNTVIRIMYNSLRVYV